MNYNTDELMEIAILIEKNGKSYYEKMADRSDDVEVRQIFSFLAREESNHEDTLTKIRERLVPVEDDNIMIAEEYKSPDIKAYLDAIFDGCIFSTKREAELEASITNDVQAVRHAISLEKDTLIFFNEILSNLGTDNENIPLLKEIIRQEKIHIVKLHTLLLNFK